MGTWWKLKFSGSTLDLLNQKLWGWGRQSLLNTPSRCCWWVWDPLAQYIRMYIRLSYGLRLLPTCEKRWTRSCQCSFQKVVPVFFSDREGVPVSHSTGQGTLVQLWEPVRISVPWQILQMLSSAAKHPCNGGGCWREELKKMGYKPATVHAGTQTWES